MTDLDKALDAAVDVKDGWTQPWQHVRVLAAEVGRLQESLDRYRDRAFAADTRAARLEGERDQWREADSRSVDLGAQYWVRALAAEREAKRLQTEVAAVLDRYSNDEQPEECEPEDRWRLFRDLRVVLAEKVQPGDEVDQRCAGCGHYEGDPTAPDGCITGSNSHHYIAVGPDGLALSRDECSHD